MRTRVGRKRCMPSNIFTDLMASARKTFKGQPVSTTSSRVRRLRTQLAKRELKRFQPLS